jgi:uncharacterized Zn finger protein (UPF0148 family)
LRAAGGCGVIASMLCPDDGAALREEGDGRAACPTCRGHALAGAAFAAAYPGVEAALAPERDPESGAFARERPCPGCGVPMAPLRIGGLLAWIERCGTCQLLWVERLDERVLAALRSRLARERAAATMPAEERRQMASELAGEIVDHERGLRRLRRLRALLRAARELIGL